MVDQVKKSILYTCSCIMVDQVKKSILYTCSWYNGRQSKEIYTIYM